MDVENRVDDEESEKCSLMFGIFDVFLVCQAGVKRLGLDFVLG